MPTYEYACGACGHEWEQAQRITEPPVESCPKCSAPAAHRLISGGTNFILKGGGWYSDLYASPKGGAKTESAGSSETPPTKSEGKTESSSSDASKGSGTSTSSTPATPASAPST